MSEKDMTRSWNERGKMKIESENESETEGESARRESDRVDGTDSCCVQTRDAFCYGG